MTLKTWSFSKKHNSTALPTGSSRDYNVVMKENTSIESPVFILGTGIDAGISYCQWSGNYYFVDDIVLISADQVELHCSIDVLATHKAAIGNYTAFIERAAAAHNPYIIDSALSQTQDIISQSMATTDLFTVSQTGCYIVRVVQGGDDVGITGIASYKLSARELSDMLDFLFTENNFPDVLQDGVVKSFFNPFQYILSIMWFPVGYGDIVVEGDSEPVKSTMMLGWFPVGQFYKVKSKFLYYPDITINIPTNYYSNDFRAYTGGYTDLHMFIPSLGCMQLDPLALSGDSLHASVNIDLITGEMHLGLYGRGSQGGLTVNKDCFGTFVSQIGVEIQVGQIADTTGAVIQHASDTLPALGSGAAEIFKWASETSAQVIATAHTSVVSGIRNALTPQQTVMGSQGNVADIIANPRFILYCRNYGCSEFPNAHFGRPLCSVRQISTLSGFIKCASASIALAAPDTEIDRVNAYLNSGFYYE